MEATSLYSVFFGFVFLFSLLLARLYLIKSRIVHKLFLFLQIGFLVIGSA